MGWSVGFDSNWQRDIGYGVPCVCDHPDCNEPIHRGLAHVCGGEPYGGDGGCGLYFCSKHLSFYREGTGWSQQICERCGAGDEPFEPKADTAEWLTHKLTCPTWQKHRDEFPAEAEKWLAQVERFKQGGE